MKWGSIAAASLLYLSVYASPGAILPRMKISGLPEGEWEKSVQKAMLQIEKDEGIALSLDILGDEEDPESTLKTIWASSEPPPPSENDDAEALDLRVVIVLKYGRWDSSVLVKNGFTLDDRFSNSALVSRLKDLSRISPPTDPVEQRKVAYSLLLATKEVIDITGEIPKPSQAAPSPEATRVTPDAESAPLPNWISSLLLLLALGSFGGALLLRASPRYDISGAGIVMLSPLARLRYRLKKIPQSGTR